MNKNYLSFYFRNLCVETFPSYGTDTYYDTCIYNHFYGILLRLRDFSKDFDMLVYVDQYLRKLESEKYIKKFEKLSKINYTTAKSDFLHLLGNINQITLIYKHRDNLSNFEEELLCLDMEQVEKVWDSYSLSKETRNLLDGALLKTKNAVSAKFGFKYNIEVCHNALLKTMSAVEEKLKSLEIAEIVLDSNNRLDDNQWKVFDSIRKNYIDNLENFTDTIKETFTNNRKVRYLKDPAYYLSFLMHDDIVALDENDKSSEKVFKKFYNALLYAYKLSIYYGLFDDLDEKSTLEELLSYLNDDALNVGIEEDYVDRRIEHIFFNTLNSLDVNQKFKHLPIVILGHKLSLDANTIQKISVYLDHDGISSSKPKNPNIPLITEKLKYRTNPQKVYDLDEDISDYLEIFNSYKTETVYEVSVVNEEGDLEIMNFDSENDYRKYISADCKEAKIEYMVETFLRKRDKKVYFNPLFEAL